MSAELVNDQVDPFVLGKDQVEAQQIALRMHSPDRTPIRPPLSTLPAPVRRNNLDNAAEQLRDDLQTPTPSRRLVAGGMFVAGAVAAHWHRGRS